MMKRNDHTFFANRRCKYYPCHSNADKTFNCLFCYCPLYSMGAACGGNFTYTENGMKDCSNCLIPHSEGGYQYIISKLSE